MALNIIKTDDESFTLENDELNEIYHSTAGAVQESKHVYIQAGYQIVQDKFETLNILEIGFGTGLNAWLTFLESQKHKTAIRYLSLEPFPIAASIYDQLNYPNHKNANGDPEVFLKLHSSPWQVEEKIGNYFTLYKDKSSLEKFSYADLSFHLVYFDAFSPDIQAELWTTEVFKKLFKMMVKGGVLVTYSAKGKVRRSLQEAGFIVERIDGPPGKREMLRTTK